MICIYVIFYFHFSYTILKTFFSAGSTQDAVDCLHEDYEECEEIKEPTEPTGFCCCFIWIQRAFAVSYTLMSIRKRTKVNAVRSYVYMFMFIHFCIL